MKNYLFVLLSWFFVGAIQSQELYFPPNFSSEWETIDPLVSGFCSEEYDAFNAFLEGSNTKACIVLKDGKIAFESYFDDFDVNSSWYWASAGKTLTAATIGILQAEGVLSIGDRTSDYLGVNWTNCTSEDENKITIFDQLTMTTGLDYTQEDLYCTAPECLFCLHDPGEEWYYHNAPYTLLADVIEAATDKNYTMVTNSMLTGKIGFLGLWTNVNTGRLFFSTARGMARFGLLMLAGGYWDGEDVLLDEGYVQDMITPSQEINQSYGYLWWLNGQESYRLPGSLITFNGPLIPAAPDDLYAAIGANGQIIMVVPSQNLVVVRMGENPDESLVPTTYVNELWDALSSILCTTSSYDHTQLEVALIPSIGRSSFRVRCEEPVSQIKLFSLNGEVVLESQSGLIDVSSLSNGVYLVQVVAGKKISTRKFIKW